MKRIVCLLLAVIVIGGQEARAQGIDVAFNNQPMSEVIRTVSELSVYPLVFAPTEDDTRPVNWKQRNLSQEQLFQNFKTIAESLGYTVKRVDTPKPYYVVDHSAQYLPNTKYSSIDVFNLRNSNAEDVQEIAKSLFGERLEVGVNKDNNLVVYSGGSETVKAFRALLPRIDKQIDEGILQVRLKYISVSEGVRAIKNLKIIEEDKFYPDYWNQSVLINGTDREKFLSRSVLKALDIEKEDYKDQVYYLHSKSAEIVADVVAEVHPECHIRKIGEKALLISGKPEDVERSERLVKQIDGTGLQVKVEAVIAYLTDSEMEELGMRLAERGSGIFGKLNGRLTIATGQSLQAFVEDLTGFTLEAEKSKGYSSIVSSPTLTVLNGHSARLAVGQNVPYLSTANFDQNDGEAVGTSIERTDIGVTFEVKPTVDPSGDFVSLEIRNEISRIAPASQLGQQTVDVVFDKQEVKSDILIANGQTVFLGGLKIDENGKSKSYIPFLSALPVIGEYMFTYDADKTEKVNLVVSLRVEVLG